MHSPLPFRVLPISLGLLLLAAGGCSREPAPEVATPPAATQTQAPVSPPAEAPAPTAATSESQTQADAHDAGHAEEHAHANAIDPGTRVAPEGGWASDAPLRQGMQAILDAVVAAVRAQGEGPALAAELRAQIDFLFANCRLEPEADAALHGILAELLLSAQRLEAGASAVEEHDALHASLQRYGQQFQHPDWPLR